MAQKYEFQPAGDCQNPDWCKLYAMCWQAGVIRGELNPDLTGCSHEQASSARQEVKDTLDLNKPLPPGK